MPLSIERIRAIPGEDGFWKDASEKTFIRAAFEMSAKGMNDDDVEDILEDLYRAVAEEFGG